MHQIGEEIFDSGSDGAGHAIVSDGALSATVDEKHLYIHTDR
jgi:hypothetical protein